VSTFPIPSLGLQWTEPIEPLPLSSLPLGLSCAREGALGVLAAVVGRGERAASWPLFYMARCALLRWPSPAPPCHARWSRSYETDAPRRRHGHGISGEANTPCAHPSSSSPIFKGAPCLAAWQGLQRVSPSLYRAVAGGMASPWPGSSHGERARRSHVQPVFPSARWLGVAPFWKAVCARMCVLS
jgi:hypothetical protein